jgi:hypothetical protein
MNRVALFLAQADAYQFTAGLPDGWKKDSE